MPSGARNLALPPWFHSQVSLSLWRCTNHGPTVLPPHCRYTCVGGTFLTSYQAGPNRGQYCVAEGGGFQCCPTGKTAEITTTTTVTAVLTTIAPTVTTKVAATITTTRTTSKPDPCKTRNGGVGVCEDTTLYTCSSGWEAVYQLAPVSPELPYCPGMASKYKCCSSGKTTRMSECQQRNGGVGQCVDTRRYVALSVVLSVLLCCAAMGCHWRLRTQFPRRIHIGYTRCRRAYLSSTPDCASSASQPLLAFIITAAVH